MAATGFAAAFAASAFLASAANARFFRAALAFAAGRVGAEIFHDLSARLFQVEAQTTQNRCRQSIFFAQQRQQKMFGADVIMAHPARFVGGQFQNAFGFGRQFRLARCRVRAGLHFAFDFGAHLAERNAHFGENLRGHAFVFAHETKQ